MAEKDLSGIWESRYVYHDGGAESVHEVQVRQNGSHLHGNGYSQSEDDSSLSFDLILEGPNKNLAMGHWRERTSSDGPYRGMVFLGVGQLIIRDETYMSGEWVGHDSVLENINHGKWELTRKENGPGA